MVSTSNINVKSIEKLITPSKVKSIVKITDPISNKVVEWRETASNIISGKDPRLLVIVGPCSIHDKISALEYANKLKNIADSVSSKVFVVMRVYFEKPRTTIGWKGLINDPYLDGTFKINEGIRIGRKVLHDITSLGLPTGTEYLDLISPQYISDIVSWGAIGARTTESQCHRELASGLSCPVGFKNGTDGNLQIAIDAIKSASNAHHFLSVTKSGDSAIFSTSGNNYCHVILRGGRQKTNYDSESLDEVEVNLQKANLPLRIMIDCSHANSQKQFKEQITVAKNIAAKVSDGDNRIQGLMIESNLVEGNQKIISKESLVYGQSITDSCLGWDDTEELIDCLSEAASKRRINAKY